MQRNNLIKARQKQGLTQIQLAKLLEIGERQYARLEAGTSDGSVKVWQDLKKILGRSIDDLLEQNDDQRI